MLSPARAASTAALCAALVAWDAPEAAAQTAADVAQARDLFTQGSERAQLGKWDEARELYGRSLSLKRAPITLYSLGIAQKNTGRMVDALENLRAFLAEPSVAATQPYEAPARDAITELEARVGRITVQVEPPSVAGLSVLVDGAALPAAAIGVARPIDPGDHLVIATAPGRREARARLTIAEGAHEKVSLSLPPAPATGRNIDARGAGADRADRDATGPSLVLPAALIIGGVAALGAGITVGLIGVGEASDAPASDGPEADAARVKMVTGDVVGGVGLVAAAVGVVLLVTRRAPSPKTAAGTGVWIGAGSAGLRARF